MVIDSDERAGQDGKGECQTVCRSRRNNTRALQEERGNFINI